MNAYQEKLIELFRNANVAGWKIEPQGEDIYIEMPNVTDIKLIRDNVPAIIAAMSLDVDAPKERVKLIFHNGFEQFEYLLNPDDEDLNKE